MKKSFVLYHDLYEPMRSLTDAQLGILTRMMFEYNITGDANAVQCDDQAILVCFGFLKATFDRDKDKYLKRCDKNKENANKRWHANASERMRSDAKHADSGSDKGQRIVIKDSDNNISSVDDHDFKKFWDLYDKKVDHKKCLAKWKRLKQSDRDNIFKALPAYITSTPDKVYRKNPLTYLNGNGWESEIIKKDKGGAKKNGFNEPGYYGESTPENDYF